MNNNADQLVGFCETRRHSNDLRALISGDCGRVRGPKLYQSADWFQTENKLNHCGNVNLCNGGLCWLSRKQFPSGKITRDEFIAFYKNQFPNDATCEFCNRVFRAIDKDGNGTIEFEEFLFFLKVARRGSPEERLRIAFQLYRSSESKDNEEISRKEIIETLTVSRRHLVCLMTQSRKL